MFGKSTKQPRRQVESYVPHRVAGTYDASRRTPENAGLWSHTDSLSAATANNPAVRKTIRERARYEAANNSYADGIVDTLVSDILGAWVTPQVQTESGNPDPILTAFSVWATEINLWAKVRMMIRSKIVDGESFALFINGTNSKAKEKLNVLPIECDMVESWFTSKLEENEIDGIRFTADMKPIEYRILKQHPGDYRIQLKTNQGTWIKAKHVIHYFSQLRPGQVRGISDLTPALELFGKLRSYTSSVLDTAARAAEISGVLQTNLVPETEDCGVCAADMKEGTILPAARNAFLSLPEGWSLNQLKSEQPTTTYAMFKREIISEIARCQNLPYNVAACDSSSYNYASGRLDHQTYDRSIEVERATIVDRILNPIFFAWLDEHIIIAQRTEKEVQAIRDGIEWYFTSRGHVDPAKEANADEIRLNNGTLTLREYWSRQGVDWRKPAQDRINERVTMERMWNDARAKAGLDPAPFPSVLVINKGGNDAQAQNAE